MHAYTTTLAAALACAAPAASHAECLTAADMREGVTFSREEPALHSDFVHQADGLILERRVTQTPDSSASFKETAYLRGLVAVELKQNGQPTIVTRLNDEDDIPDIVPAEGAFELSGLIEVDGLLTDEIFLSYAMPGESGTVDIGGCDYETVLVRHVAKIIDAGDSANRGSLFFEYQYSPQLGIVLETIQYTDATL